MATINVQDVIDDLSEQLRQALVQNALLRAELNVFKAEHEGGEDHEHS